MNYYSIRHLLFLSVCVCLSFVVKLFCGHKVLITWIEAAGWAIMQPHDLCNSKRVSNECVSFGWKTLMQNTHYDQGQSSLLTKWKKRQITVYAFSTVGNIESQLLWNIFRPFLRPSTQHNQPKKGNSRFNATRINIKHLWGIARHV